MKLNRDNISGRVVKSNDVYTVIDNTDLTSLVVSKTVLHPQKETTGHSHDGQEEVYQFVYGTGRIEVGQNKFDVSAGDVVSQVNANQALARLAIEQERIRENFTC